MPNENEAAKETVDTVVENAELNENGASDNDADFEDGAKEGEAAPTGEKTETETGKGEKADQSKPKQSKEQNSEYARKRREAEREAELKSVREKAIIEALGGVNPFTNEKIEDSNDIEEYFTMKEIEKNGGDPLLDFSKYAKEKARKKAEEEAKAKKEEEWYRNDAADFKAKYPDVNLDELTQNTAFQKYADGKVGKTPIAEIYAGFNEIIAEYEKQAQSKATQIVANQKASVGSLSTTGTADSGNFTREQVAKMSPEDVHRNYDKIRESMKHWK